MSKTLRMSQWGFYKLYYLKWNTFLNLFGFTILLIFKFHGKSFLNTKRGLPINFLKLIFFNNLLKFIKKSPFTFSKLFLKYKFASYKYFANYDNSEEGILMIEHLALLGHILIKFINLFLDFIEQKIIF